MRVHGRRRATANGGGRQDQLGQRGRLGSGADSGGLDEVARRGGATPATTSKRYATGGILTFLRSSGFQLGSARVHGAARARVGNPRCAAIA
jgi:hypothetical protein